jgi:hypothetical protein
VKRTCPKGEEGQRWKRGGDCKAEEAPGVSLDGVRRSEKAEEPEKTGAETSAGCDASKNKKKRKKKHTQTHNALHAAAADVSTAVERLLN